MTETTETTIDPPTIPAKYQGLKQKGMKYPGRGRPRKTPEEKAAAKKARLRERVTVPYLPIRQRPLNLVQLENLLQEVLKDTLRHQKRCDTLLEFFKGKVCVSGIPDDPELYSTNVKALLDVVDMHDKHIPSILKTIGAMIENLPRLEEQIPGNAGRIKGSKVGKSIDELLDGD